MIPPLVRRSTLLPRNSATFGTVQIFSAFPSRLARRIAGVRPHVINGKKDVGRRVIGRAFGEHAPIAFARSL
jgi:hypothetical protein